jgi:hypothetical protein
MAININSIDYANFLKTYEHDDSTNKRLITDNSNVPILISNPNFNYKIIRLRFEDLPKSATTGLPDRDKLIALKYTVFPFQDTTHAIYSTAKNFAILSNVVDGAQPGGSGLFWVEFSIINQEAL